MPDLPTLILLSAGLSFATAIGLFLARDMHHWFEERAWHRAEMRARTKLSEPVARVAVATRPAPPPPQLPRPVHDDGWVAAERIRFERVCPRELCPDEEWIGG